MGCGRGCLRIGLQVCECRLLLLLLILLFLLLIPPRVCLTATSCRSFDKGFDVWMLTLRGCGRRRHVIKAVARGRSYWNFNLDDHGNQDVACAVRLIHSTKAAELALCDDSCGASVSNRFDSSSDHYSSTTEESGSAHSDSGRKVSDAGPPFQPPALGDCVSRNLDVTLVAHSMGCAASIIFMTCCLHRHLQHGISRAVLLAPAGYHAYSAPIACRVLGPFINVVVCRLTNSFCLPYGNAQLILGKLLQDVLSLPALRDLFALVISGLIGGALEVCCFSRAFLSR